jgi:hypothetical protein
LVTSIKDNKHLACIAHGQPADLDGLGGPFKISHIDVPVFLPGTLRASFAETGPTGGKERDIPVEEAIRPPWIDKDVYSAEASEVAEYSKLCVLYRELFHSPSIIHPLLLQTAKPYDGMSVHSVEQAVDYLVASIASKESSTARDSYVGGAGSRQIASLPDVLAPKGWLPEQQADGTHLWKPHKDVAGKWLLGADSVDDFQVSGGFHPNAVTGLRFSEGNESILKSPDEMKFGSKLEFLDLENTSLGSRLQPDTSVSITEEAAIRADPRAPRAYRVKEYADDISGSATLRQVGFGSGIKFITTPPGIGKKG